MWRPGEELFSSDERDAQPANTPVSGVRTPLEPPELNTWSPAAV